MMLPFATLVALLAAGPLAAQTPPQDPQGHHGGQPQMAADEFIAGEVRRVDKDAQKVTLRHGPIPNLGMGDMTMVFRVADPKLLDGLKPGDKVRFRADRMGGQMTVTELVPAQ
jgi:Cu(I)/Ag(I) efflux system protein CusF